MPCQAEMEGSRAKALIWLRVSSVKGSKAGQRLGGKEMWHEDKMEIKWFLAVRMARSAGRER